MYNPVRTLWIPKTVNPEPRTIGDLQIKPHLVLGGSWYLVTNYDCTYNPNYNSIRALKGLLSTVISTVIIG